jgi:glycosyltransferase involved in cell wall biosynthesis
MSEALRVLVLADWFPPATKAGGPAKTLARIAEEEGILHQVAVVTRDRDLGDSEPYAGVEVGIKVRRGPVVAVYVPPRVMEVVRTIRGLAKGRDVIYINSVFSPPLGLAPLVLFAIGLLRPSTLLVAPRGELGEGALAIKAMKKRPVLRALKVGLGRRRHVVWHASSARERADIIREFGPDSHILVQVDPPPRPAHVSEPPEGPLNIVFLARMVPIKNFLLLAQAAKHLQSETVIQVIGSLEDKAYWARCQEALRDVPPHVTVITRGHLEETEIDEILATSDAMVLPTRGENFGHAIAEALSVGCPVLIPDTTPWTGVVESGGGSIIDPDDAVSLARRLDRHHEAGNLRRNEERQAVLDVYRRWWQEQRADTNTFSLFTHAHHLAHAEGIEVDTQ